MTKTDWKYLVDVFLFLCMFGIISIGLLMAFFLPQGPTSAEIDKYFLNLHRHQWGNIHLYLSLAFVGFLIIHLILEWSWIKGKSRRVFKKNWKRALMGMIFGSIVVLFLLWAFSPKYAVEYFEYGRRKGDRPGRLAGASSYKLPPATDEPKVIPQTEPTSPSEKETALSEEAKVVSGRDEAAASEIVITGRMTLREVEKLTGIRAELITENMGLPNNISKDDSLGRLRRRYGFTLPQLREVLSALMEKK